MYWVESQKTQSYLCSYLLSLLWSSFLFVKWGWVGRTSWMILIRPHPHGVAGLKLKKEKDELQVGPTLGALATLTEQRTYLTQTWLEGP